MAKINKSNYPSSQILNFVLFSLRIFTGSTRLDGDAIGRYKRFALLLSIQLMF